MPERTYDETEKGTVDIESQIVDEWEGYAQLKQICSCESTGQPYNEPRHFLESGEVILGVINSDDIGMCQINSYYHGTAAQKLDLNLYDRHDNLKYAKYLYDREGGTPWNWSKHCWSK